MTESEPLSPQARFDAYLGEGRFMLQRAAASGAAIFYPRVAEPGTGDPDLRWEEASGDGVVYATTVIRPRPPEQPYNVALIALAEGPRMMSRVIGIEPERVEIDMPVRAEIIYEGGKPLLVFRAGESGR